MRFDIPVTWRVFAIVTVEAETIDEAVEKAGDRWAHRPEDASYEDGSFTVDEREARRLYPKPKSVLATTQERIAREKYAPKAKRVRK